MDENEQVHILLGEEDDYTAQSRLRVAELEERLKQVEKVEQDRVIAALHARWAPR